MGVKCNATFVKKKKKKLWLNRQFYTISFDRNNLPALNCCKVSGVPSILYVWVLWPSNTFIDWANCFSKTTNSAATSSFVVAGHCPSWRLEQTVLPSLLWVSRTKIAAAVTRRRRVHGFSHCKLCVCCLSVAFVQQGGIGDPFGPEIWTRRWRERSLFYFVLES